MRPEAEKIAAFLLSHDDIAILTHLHPDGDALGSSLALQMALTARNKRALVLCQDPCPAYLRMLPAAGRLCLPEELPFQPGAYIYVDCAQPARVGRVADTLVSDIDTACIDHHVPEGREPALQLIDPEAAAAGELVYEVIQALNVPLDLRIALCLYVAVVTDTGGFAFDSTRPASLELAAKCVACGVKTGEINYAIFREKSAPRTRLLGRALDGVAYEAGGRLAFMGLRQSDFADCGAEMADTEGVVNYGIDTSGVRVAILAVEQSDGSVKFSLRSRGGADVAALARLFGGGGHVQAAGVTIRAPYTEACARVLKAARALCADGEAGA